MFSFPFSKNYALKNYGWNLQVKHWQSDCCWGRILGDLTGRRDQTKDRDGDEPQLWRQTQRTAAFLVTVSARKLEIKDQRLYLLHNSGNLYLLSSLLLWWFLDSFPVVISIRPLTTRKACLLTFQGNTQLEAVEATSFKQDMEGKFPRDGKSYRKGKKQGM